MNTRIEVLNKDNYDTWKLQMEALLIKSDAWGYVNGVKVKPDVVLGNDGNPTQASARATETWIAADLKAKSDLILSISPSELKQIKNCETSREVWIKLQSIYQSTGPARKATLLKQLTLQKMAEGEDTRDHIRRFFDAVDKLEEMEVNVNEDLLTILLLYSLPASYENFRCAIESRDDLPKPEILKIKILEESDARRSKVRECVPGAMYASTFKRKGHFQKKPENPNSKNSENGGNEKSSHQPFKYKCSRCKKVGHKAKDCYSKRQNTKQNANTAEELCYTTTTEESADLSFQSALKVSVSANKQLWCLDSGCTSHMCGFEGKFQTLLASNSSSVNLANHATTNIQGKGSVKIDLCENNVSKTIKLENTLLVPDLRSHLISVGKIADNGYEILFRKNDAIVFDTNGNAKMFVDRINGLYYV